MQLGVYLYLPDGQWRFTNSKTGEIVEGNLDRCLLEVKKDLNNEQDVSKRINHIKLYSLLRGVAYKKDTWIIISLGERQLPTTVSIDYVTF